VKHIFLFAPHSATSRRSAEDGQDVSRGDCGVADIETKPAPTEAAKRAYWRSAKRLTIGLLSVWFAVSFGAGILFRDWLDAFSIGGAPLGFWFAQQGAIYVFVVLIFVYCWAMRRIERKFGVRV
jgi:putative solute:sodium symporter small subunit